MKEKKEKAGTAVVPVQAPVLVKRKVEIAKIKEQGASILSEAQALVLKIGDSAARERAAEMRTQAKKLDKEIDAKFDGARDAAYKIYQLVKNGIDDMKADASKAVKVLDAKMSAYDLEIDRLAKIESDKAEAEKARLDKIERDKLEAKAKKADEKGQEEKADLLREQAAQVNNFVPPAITGPDKTFRTDSGTTSGSKDFDVVILQGMEVLRAIVAGTLLPGAVNIKRGPDGRIEEMRITPATIKKIAEMNVVGDMLPIIPGCKLVRKISYGSRTGK
jgi:primosomal protein N'